MIYLVFFFFLPLVALWVFIVALFILDENRRLLALLSIIWGLAFILLLLSRGRLFFPFIAIQGILGAIAGVRLRLALA